MMKDFVDLHLHSTFSDGHLSPAELVARAAGAGLRAIAITDHDNVDGVPEAIAAGRRAGIEIVSGVELSVVWQNYQEIHLLGYDFDPQNAFLQRSLQEFRAFRANRSREILTRVNQRLIDQNKPPLDFAKVADLAGGTLGRPHIGQALLNAGHVRSMEQAFQAYLVPCNIPKRHFPVNDAIDMLHGAGGCAVLAHPPFIGIAERELEGLVDSFIDMKLDGLEVYNGGADNATIDRHLTLARRRNLIVTGGSDFHRDEPAGAELGRWRGDLKISYRCVEEIHARALRYRQD